MAFNPYLQQKTTVATAPSNGGVTPANPYVRAGVVEGQVANAATVPTSNVVTQPVTTQPKSSNPYQKKYKEQSIMNMTQGELLLKLYDEIIKQLNISITSIDDQEDAVENEEVTPEQLKLQNDAAREMALKQLEGLAKKMFEDEGQEYSEADLKGVVTEKAIQDMVKQYDVKFNNNGGKAKNKENYILIEKRHISVKKINKIIDHLRMTLNFDYDISNNLNDLYLFFKRNVNEANNKNESKPLKDILPLVQDLRDAYAEAEQNVKTGKGQIASN